MPRIIAVPLASKLHKKKYWKRVLKDLSQIMKEENIPVTDVEYSYPFKSTVFMDDFIILIHLTGGTSKLAKKIIERLKYPALLLSHSRHNSLASALSVREKYPEKAKICLLTKTISSRRKLQNEIKALRVVNSLFERKIVAFNVTEKTDEALKFESVFDSRIVPVSLNDIERRLKRVDRQVAEKIVSERLPKFKGDGDVIKAVKLYLALKKIIAESKATAATMNCFEYIMKKGISPCIPLALLNDDGIPTSCEEDYSSLVGLIIGRELSSSPCWMANLTEAEGYKIVFSHCTAPLTMLKEHRKVTHFETDRPLTITGKMNIPKLVTFFRINREFNEISCGLGTVIDSGMIDEKQCRIQLHLKAYNEIDENTFYGNHHIIVPGKHVKLIRSVAFFLRCRFHEI
ncbi:MAG TPA: hypothetical protein ENG22_03695 [Candidatus Bathyarchaeota archaeon]|nr:hypothetical protein [Candidatus Bathyarchaeota archaeon]